MNRTIRRRREARQFPRFEGLEVRSLLSLYGAPDPFTGSSAGEPVPLLTGNATGATNALTALESDGSIIQVTSFNNGVGYSTGSFSIVKYNADGSIDTSFGQDGRATIGLGLAPTDATTLVVQPDGMIDVGGTIGAQEGSTNGVIGVIQVTPQGTLDTSYGNGGIASVPYQSVQAMTLTSSGQLLVAGENQNFATGAISVTRLQADGTIDGSFGTNGIAAVPVTINEMTNDEVTAIAVQPSGRIIVAGNAMTGAFVHGVMASLDLYSTVVIGLTSSGSLDTSFGGTSAAGEVVLSPLPAGTQGDRVVAGMALQSNGQIVLAGSEAPYSGSEVGQSVGELTRLNADGTLDTTFGDAGTDSLTDGLVPNGLTVTANGLIVVPGEINGSSEAVGLFNTDGTPDASFGSTATPGLLTDSSQFQAGGTLSTAVIDSTGRIVLGGTYSVSTGSTTGDVSYFQLGRITAPPITTPALSQPPADFDGSGKTNLAVYLPASGSFAYRPTNGGPDVIEQFGIPGVGQTIPAPGDYSGAGQTELGAYLPSQGVYAYRPANGGPDVLEAFGIPGPGQSIPAPGDYFGTGVDDIAVYMPSIGAFGIRNPNGGPDLIEQFGIAGAGQSIPAPGDYFGTGQTDLAVYLPSLGAFAIRNPAGGPDEIIPFGIPGAGNSIPIPGDYDGSGKTELAVYLPKLGEFAYRPANGGPDVIEQFGAVNDGSIPVPGDYTGVGYDEIGIFDPNYADFAYRPANGGADVIEQFGSPGMGASLPLAAPIASNVTLANPTTVSALSVASSTVSSESVKVAVTTRTTIPTGPKAKLAAKALVRITSTPPAQADPSKPKG